MPDPNAPTSPRVGLFVTCLVDLFRPNIGFATARLLTAAGCTPHVPVSQTCCGQPGYHNGILDDTRSLAKQTITAFESYDYIAVPSGSCAGQLRKYPLLFSDQPQWRRRAEALARRTHDILSFLIDVVALERPHAYYPHRVTYHDSCSSLRQLAVKEQPRRLLARVEGLKLVEMADTDICCGFGAPFVRNTPKSPRGWSPTRSTTSWRAAPIPCSRANSACPAGGHFLADDHLIVLYSHDIVDYFEEVWERLAATGPSLPRATNMITGPSRTADVEQTLQLGAHGPRRVHLLLIT